MTVLNLRWLAAITAVYLFLLPTNHGTYLRSIAFGGSILFTVFALGWSLRERDGRPEARIPMPPWSIVVTVAAWFTWSAVSYFWSVKPRYTSGQLSREVAENALLVVVFYVACFDIVMLRRYAAIALAGFVIMGTLAIVYSMSPAGWDPALKHNGVGPYSTYVVLIAPWFLTLIAPTPIGLQRRGLALLLGAVLLALLVASARLTENRMVWIALAAVFAVAAIASAARWPRTFMRSPWRWLAPVAALLVILGFAFADAARERAQSVFPPNTSVETTIKADPRLRLWQQLTERIGDRVWQGYGFGRRIQAEEIAGDLADLQLTHAHNLFVSQWLQTGAVGLGLFVVMLGAIATTFVRYVRARDDVLAFLGVVGLCLLTGFIVKNLTDDFLFRSNAKEFWAMISILVGLERGFPRAAPRASTSNAMPAPSAEIVIINCSTRELTALALVSALRHGGLPVTVIDCESTDGSMEFFQTLQRQLQFDLAQLPLRRHGVTLDRIFRETTRDALLLLDSDAEILDPRLVPAMRRALQPGTYGSGFLHAAEWLAADHGGGDHKGYYAERMWIPCVMLDAAIVGEALAAGQSFRQRVIGNEMPQWPWLSQLLRLRFRVPGLRALSLDALHRSRRDYRGLKPHYVYCDTGADMHDYLVNRRGLAFADLGSAWWPTAVAHYHGITRRQLRPWMRNAASVSASRSKALERIAKVYGVDLPAI